MSKDYKAKARSLMFNLRDEKNPDLRSSVLSGDIMPAALVKLEPKDLASKHMKERNARIVEEMTRNAMGPSANVESTDQFQCGKCKQNKCTYYQMQTRSSDEPMTTFVTWLVCIKIYNCIVSLVYALFSLSLKQKTNYEYMHR